MAHWRGSSTKQCHRPKTLGYLYGNQIIWLLLVHLLIGPHAKTFCDHFGNVPCMGMCRQETSWPHARVGPIPNRLPRGDQEQPYVQSFACRDGHDFRFDGSEAESKRRPQPFFAGVFVEGQRRQLLHHFQNANPKNGLPIGKRREVVFV